MLMIETNHRQLVDLIRDCIGGGRLVDGISEARGIQHRNGCHPSNRLLPGSAFALQCVSDGHDDDGNGDEPGARFHPGGRCKVRTETGERHSSSAKCRMQKSRTRGSPALPIATCAFLTFGALGAAAGAVAQPTGAGPMLARIGTYVEQYYSRAQSIVARERVTLQPLARDLGFDGFARRLEYEIRVEWNPSASGDEAPATVVRELVSVNGRPPKKDEEPRCVDPRGVSPEPLATLLPDRRHKYSFSAAGGGQVRGRAATIIEYRSLRPEPPQVEWKDECVSIELPGRTRGRVWADPDTAEILRFDEQLTGMVDIAVPRAQQRIGASAFMTIERADLSIQYRQVAFDDPDETLMLPSLVESLVIVRNSGTPRMRITQTYDDYRRFVTESRIVR
jgi:hypothetical protein